MISVIVLTKNEEKNIIDCIESVLTFDEIIIIDDNSTDRTKQLVENLAKTQTKIKFFSRALDNDFSTQRQYGIDKCKNDWIFFVDSDERITRELRSEINESISENTPCAGFLIQRIDFMWGKKLAHGETGNIKLLRLFNKKKGNLKGKVHESWITKDPVEHLINPILHYPHPSVNEFLSEINFYTDLRAQELFKKKKKVNIISILIYPTAKFFVNYFLKRGFIDGNAGLVHAILMSFHSFLVRGKLWLLWQKPHLSA